MKSQFEEIISGMVWSCGWYVISRILLYFKDWCLYDFGGDIDHLYQVVGVTSGLEVRSKHNGVFVKFGQVTADPSDP